MRVNIGPRLTHMPGERGRGRGLGYVGTMHALVSRAMHVGMIMCHCCCWFRNVYSRAGGGLDAPALVSGTCVHDERERRADLPAGKAQHLCVQRTQRGLGRPLESVHGVLIDQSTRPGGVPAARCVSTRLLPSACGASCTCHAMQCSPARASQQVPHSLPHGVN